jgi:hypothetical protein
MTGVLLVAIYLVALSFFLGLDILARVPQTLYAVVVAGLGAVIALALFVSAMPTQEAHAPASVSVGGLASLLGASFAMFAGVGAMSRLLGAFKKKPRS